MRKKPLGNHRVSSRKHRTQQHLLDVKVRSRTAARQRTRWTIKWLCLSVLLVSAVGSVYYGSRVALDRFFWRNPDYQVAQIDVVDDGALSRVQIIAASGVKTGENIFVVDLSAAREKLGQLPQVEHVEVERILPGKVSINVTERKPVAWVTAKSEDDPSSQPSSLLIDRNGALVDAKSRLPAYLHLPVISGVALDKWAPGQIIATPEVKAALDLLRITAEEPGQFQIRSIDVSKGYCMIVTDRSHARVTFGLERLDWQLNRLGVLLHNVEQNDHELLTANLLVERNIPVTYAAPEEIAETAPVPAPLPNVKTSAPARNVATPRTTPAARGRRAPTPRPRPTPTPPTIRKALPVHTPELEIKKNA